jgi:hypothetical protein
MVCNTQDYWVFGLCPSSGILEATKHNVSETGSVSILSWGMKGTYSTGSIRKSKPRSQDNPFQYNYSYIHIRDHSLAMGDNKKMYNVHLLFINFKSTCGSNKEEKSLCSVCISYVKDI